MDVIQQLQLEAGKCEKIPLLFKEHIKKCEATWD